MVIIQIFLGTFIGLALAIIILVLLETFASPLLDSISEGFQGIAHFIFAAIAFLINFEENMKQFIENKVEEVRPKEIDEMIDEKFTRSELNDTKIGSARDLVNEENDGEEDYLENRKRKDM